MSRQPEQEVEAVSAENESLGPRPEPEGAETLHPWSVKSFRAAFRRGRHRGVGSHQPPTRDQAVRQPHSIPRCLQVDPFDPAIQRLVQEARDRLAQKNKEKEATTSEMPELEDCAQKE